MAKQKEHLNGQNGHAKLQKKNLLSSAAVSLSHFIFWTDKYGERLEKLWKHVPEHLSQLVVTLAMFILGITVRGEWLLFAAYFVKYLHSEDQDNYDEKTDQMINSVSEWLSVKFNGFTSLWIWSTVFCYVSYFGIGGFLHWYYYVNRRDQAAEWKCQPNKWLTPELERQEIMLGSLTLLVGTTMSAAIATYIMNGGGGTKVYFQPGEFGYIWLVLQVPLIFIYVEYVIYWFHRMYHTPFLYKHIHKLHHNFKQPTAFSATAAHPLELILTELGHLSAIVIVPIYWLNFVIVYFYIGIHNIMDHSGINFKRYWWQPWQADSIFHDNHHQYTNINFGLNMELWDRIHGTMRTKDRIYGEDTLNGCGKRRGDEASEEIRKIYKDERESENPKAYKENINQLKLD